MARCHQRWRVIQFLPRVPRHWMELIPRWKAGLHPGLLVVVIPPFRCNWIFLEIAAERTMDKEGRTTPISSRLFYSSCFFHSFFDRRRRKPRSGNSPSQGSRRKIPVRSLSIFFTLLSWSFYYVLCIYILRLSSCDIFSTVIIRELG